MFALHFTHVNGSTLTKSLQSVETLAAPPAKWRNDARRGHLDYDCTNRRLMFGGASGVRNVYRDSDGLFILQARERVRLPIEVVGMLGAFAVWGAEAQGTAETRRSRADCLKMPEMVTDAVVVDVLQWPLGAVMTRKAAGENWTDCLIELVDEIRLGGRHNSRRVRYDGSFYIMHNGRRVEIGGELALRVLDVASHVYGQDAESDKLHNVSLKGY